MTLVLPATSRQFLDLLQSWVDQGVAEDPPGSNCNFISRDVLGYCDQWCAATPMEAMLKLGIDPSLVGASGYCPTWEARARALGLWIEAADLDQVRPGDGGTIDWYGTGESWHFFTVKAIAPEGVWTYEGNYGDRVDVWLRTGMIRGFIRFPWRDRDGISVPTPLPTLSPVFAEENMSQMSSASGRGLDTDWYLAGAYAGDDADEVIEIHDENDDPGGNPITVWVTCDDGTGSDGQWTVTFNVPGRFRRASFVVNRTRDHNESLQAPEANFVAPADDMTKGQGVSIHVQAVQPVTVGRTRLPRKVWTPQAA